MAFGTSGEAATQAAAATLTECASQPASETGAASAGVSLRTHRQRESFTRMALGAQAPVVRALSMRCSEAQAQSLPNQDYALVKLLPMGERGAAHAEGSTLCFCVCDGVGSSFKGDFAAAYLATQLVNWLAALQPRRAPRRASADTRTAWREETPDAALQTSLTHALNAWATEGQRQIMRLPLTAESAIVREALDDLRRDYGSETVFFAGRVDRFASNDRGMAEREAEAEPTWRSQALLCWMGNVSAQVYSQSGEALPLPAMDDDRRRWSTGRGVRGEVEAHIYSLDALSRILIHTDGANPFSAQLAQFDDETLQREALRLLTLPSNDDITILDIQLSGI
ncbi:MAG: hypothetical protein ABI274_16180 [Ktedonobacterales bacterium]